MRLLLPDHAEAYRPGWHDFSDEVAVSAWLFESKEAAATFWTTYANMPGSVIQLLFLHAFKTGLKPQADDQDIFANFAKETNRAPPGAHGLDHSGRRPVFVFSSRGCAPRTPKPSLSAVASDCLKTRFCSRVVNGRPLRSRFRSMTWDHGRCASPSPFMAMMAAWTGRNGMPWSPGKGICPHQRPPSVLRTTQASAVCSQVGSGTLQTWSLNPFTLLVLRLRTFESGSARTRRESG